jgi:hypothetical protein
MVTTFSELLVNAPRPIPVTNSLAESDGKKTEEGMMTSRPETNPVAIADSPEMQMLTLSTTRQASDIQTK